MSLTPFSLSPSLAPPLSSYLLSPLPPDTLLSLSLPTAPPLSMMTLGTNRKPTDHIQIQKQGKSCQRCNCNPFIICSLSWLEFLPLVVAPHPSPSISTRDRATARATSSSKGSGKSLLGVHGTGRFPRHLFITFSNQVIGTESASYDICFGIL